MAPSPNASSPSSVVSQPAPSLPMADMGKLETLKSLFFLMNTVNIAEITAAINSALL